MKSSTLVFIVVTILVAGGAYWYLSLSKGDQAPLTASGTESDAQTKFQTLVAQLQPISFDTTIFSDPRFLALVDITTQIQPETLGRTDPFAPPAAN